jgi:hypothetical protein
VYVPLANGDKYVIERRASFGLYDQGLSGVWIRKTSSVWGADTHLIDMTPGTATLNDADLAPGKKFHDPYRRVTVKNLNDTGGPTASLEVCVAICGVARPATHTTFNCTIGLPLNARYVSTEVGYTGTNYGMLRARAPSVSSWGQRFVCIAVGTNQWVLRSRANGRYVTPEYDYASPNKGMLRARATSIRPKQKFTMIKLYGNCACYALRASNGKVVTTDVGRSGEYAGMLHVGPVALSRPTMFVVLRDGS